MTEFSTTRLADFATAETNTPLGRLSDLELYETISNAVTNGTFVITYGGNSIP